VQRVIAVVGNARALQQGVSVILTSAEIAGLGKLPSVLLPHILFVTWLRDDEWVSNVDKIINV
jgi:hypothetical protein